MILYLADAVCGERFQRKSRVVHARKMSEDFIYQTQQGWVQGYKGQWLVEIGEKLRCNLDNEAFLRCYTPMTNDGADE